MDLLIEIGCEELPVTYIGPALAHLAGGLVRSLSEAGLVGKQDARTFSTPRRLAVCIPAVSERQPDRHVERRGPSAKAAFDKDGVPTKAATGFAKSCGLKPEELERRDTGKGEYLYATVLEKGRSAGEIIAESLTALLASTPAPKTMRWGSGTFRFARPIRWIVALLGEDVVAIDIDGLASGRTTLGHRFSSGRPIEIPRADAKAYLSLLRETGVVADAGQRREMLASGVREIVARYGGTEIDEKLADYVSNLVEFPCPIEGAFDERFLALPEEVLVQSMKIHQHDFPVRDGSGKLVARFVCVSNGVPTDGGEENVRVGNEEVLRARFEDAVFFWETDRKRAMEDRVGDLANMVFQEQLGSYLDKTERVERLARAVAEAAGMSSADVKHAAEAARLSKVDLLTEMVGEFPALQGVMGGIYLREEGKPEAVWRAVRDQYLPDRVSGSEGVPGPGGIRLPETSTGAALAIADKLDNIAGCFGLGLRPSGSADPYALRRQAAGVVTIVRSRGMSVSLPELIRAAVAGVAASVECDAAETSRAVGAFFLERIKGAFRTEGIDYDISDAVLACGWDDVADAMARATALQRMRDDDIAAFVGAATVGERTANILKGVDPARLGEVDESIFAEEMEGTLHTLYRERRDEVHAAVEAADYDLALRLFTSIFAEPVHKFFEEVLVNVDDEAIRHNRLALNKSINDLVGLRVADLSRLVLTDEQREKAERHG